MSGKNAGTDWSDVRRLTAVMTDDEWSDFQTLIALSTPKGERPTIGRFIGDTIKRVYGDELRIIAEQRKALQRKIAGG